MKILLNILVLLFATYTFANQQQYMNDFTTDECTMYPEGTKKEPKLWAHCCILHDMFYWAGGSRFDMDHADLILYSCVQEVAGKTQAELMYKGIRLGHLSPISLKDKSFGNGWINPRPKTSLSDEEKDIVREKILSSQFEPKIIEQFLDQL